MSIIQNILNAITAIWAFIKAIPATINTIITWVNGIIDAIAQDVSLIYTTLYYYIQYDINYAYSLYLAVINWAEASLANFYNWAFAEIQKLYTWAGDLINDVINALNVLTQWVETQFADILLWIYNNIWDPIWNALAGALKWIATYGAFIVSLLTNPLLLAQLIGKAILGAWLLITTTLALPFFKWFYANALALIPDFASLFEDIISSLFD